jgi:hypothetical protein
MMHCMLFLYCCDKRATPNGSPIAEHCLLGFTNCTNQAPGLEFDTTPVDVPLRQAQAPPLRPNHGNKIDPIALETRVVRSSASG